jgi:hypothetical protein
MLIIVLVEIVLKISAEMLADCVFVKLELVEKKENLEGLWRAYILRSSHMRWLFFVYVTVLLYVSLSTEIVSICSSPQRIIAYVRGMKPSGYYLNSFL